MLIRHCEPVSFTITQIDSKGNICFGLAHFKSARFPVSNIIFFEHNGDLFYPLNLEFRLIDNNILYLIREMEVNDAKTLFRILESSMVKEENWTNEFKLSVVHLKNPPNFCYKIRPGFDLSGVTKQEIYE